MLKLGEVFQTQYGVSLYSNPFKYANIFKLTLKNNAFLVLNLSH